MTREMSMAATDAMNEKCMPVLKTSMYSEQNCVRLLYSVVVTTAIVSANFVVASPFARY